MNNFLNKIKKKKCKVLVIGLGYVGWPLYCTIKKKGFKVLGLDTNKSLVLKYKNKKNNLFYSYKDINFEKIDIIIIALPTPLKNKTPDLSYLKKTMELLILKLKKDTLLILESTSYPSTTEEVISSKIRKKFEIGKDFFIGYSPEREDPGNKLYNLKNTPKVFSGETKNCKKLVRKFYSLICNEIVEASTIQIAEMTKLYENIFRVINISLSNETKEICKKIKIDFYEVLKLASTKPFGFMPFEPGPGAGGHCIPVDPFYFNWYLKRKKIASSFIEIAGKINLQMPKKIFSQIKKVIRLKNFSKKEKILFLGLTYKKNIKDLRNSPSLEIFNLFKKERFNVDFNDDLLNKITLGNKTISSKNIKLFKNYKIIILSTNHDYYKKLKFNQKQIIFDLRNSISKKNRNIFKL